MPGLRHALAELKKDLAGDLLTDRSALMIYGTDASVYRELPIAVALPSGTGDVIKLVEFAANHGCPLIPRGAGTSLAGQVVGDGIVVDVSKYMNRILEIDVPNRRARVEPGVVLDEFNLKLEPEGLYFAPETSTSNRCMIGGMIGNNSSGTHSLVCGTTRDHLASVKAVLSDGSQAEFGRISRESFDEKCRGNNLEGEVYRNIREILNDPENRNSIRSGYPDPSIIRRNTGYALDVLLEDSFFSGGNGDPVREEQGFNFCKLMAGSEGTLAFLTEATLELSPLPPAEKALVCVHCNTVKEAIRANLVALEFSPSAVELVDKVVLDCTKENITQSRNRFFIKGDPGAVLIVEFTRDSKGEIGSVAEKMEKMMRSKGLGHHYPLVWGPDISRVWNLRKAGLGVLYNIPGDAKPVTVVEDTSVNVKVLEDFVDEFGGMLRKHGLECVYYAHISVGELHLRPVLNLKDPDHVALFRKVATETARIVKKFRGSLSGEHGDGRLRGEFIPVIIGRDNYELLRKIKMAWDPQGIFNPGKITETKPMDQFLRHEPGRPVREIDTVFDFSAEGGILRMAEKCNGSGDCRKSAAMGGTMCPSFMATRDEYTTTRARANLLREYLTNSGKKNPFDNRELYDVLDLCLSCKACKSECPSNVDMTKMKSEFLQHYYDANGVPLRTRLIAGISGINALGALWPGAYNLFVRKGPLTAVWKKMLGFASGRGFPALQGTTFRKWLGRHLAELNDGLGTGSKELLLFVDEFTNYNDVETGIKAVQLFTRLGYRVRVFPHRQSGRSYLSKGLLRKARSTAQHNIGLLKDHVSENLPLVGIEPSAILSFRDEYPDLAGPALKKDAMELAANTYLYDEFLLKEFPDPARAGLRFTAEKREILLHGHCQQKAIASTGPTQTILSWPEHYTVKEIPSGCCGMAGSFGYEKEHYDLSMKIGEMVLFPEIRKSDPAVLLAVPGTSCRHQVMDGTGRKASHPLEILWDALA